MTAFDPAAWVREWEELGGGWSLADGRFCFLLPPDRHDALDPMMSRITGWPGRAAAVREHVTARSRIAA